MKKEEAARARCILGRRAVAIIDKIMSLALELRRCQQREMPTRSLAITSELALSSKVQWRKLADNRSPSRPPQHGALCGSSLVTRGGRRRLRISGREHQN